MGSWAQREPALGLAALGRLEGGGGGTPVLGGWPCDSSAFHSKNPSDQAASVCAAKQIAW